MARERAAARRRLCGTRRQRRVGSRQPDPHGGTRRCRSLGLAAPPAHACRGRARAHPLW